MASSQTTSDPPNRVRFRFGLRSIFVLLTIVAVWLGFRQIQWLQHIERIRGARSLAQSLQALEKQVRENLQTPPLETTILSPAEITPDSFFADSSFEQEMLDADVDFLIRGHNQRRITRLQLVLDVRPALEVTTAWGLRKRLLAHYETGLAELGLSRVSGRDGVTDPNTPELWSVWMSDHQNPSATVWIRVRVDDEDSTEASAEVLLSGQAALD